MGGVDVVLKVCELVVYGFVIVCLGILKVCPWRKGSLAEKLKDGNQPIFLF
jgi:hypothetical protein